MAQEIDNQLGVQGTIAIVRLSGDAESIASVVVSVKQQDQPAEAADSPEQNMAEVQPVQPIDIDVNANVDDDRTGSSAFEAGQQPDEKPVLTDEQKTLIEQTLRRGWGVPAARVEIRSREA